MCVRARARVCDSSHFRIVCLFVCLFVSLFVSTATRVVFQLKKWGPHEPAASCCRSPNFVHQHKPGQGLFIDLLYHAFVSCCARGCSCNAAERNTTAAPPQQRAHQHHSQLKSKQTWTTCFAVDIGATAPRRSSRTTECLQWLRKEGQSWNLVTRLSFPSRRCER